MKLDGLRKFLSFIATIAAVWGICGLSASYLGLRGWLDNKKPRKVYPKPGESNDPM